MINWFEDDDSTLDLPSVLAAEIMGLKWTHTEDEDEHCYRYAEIQELIDKKLRELGVDTKTISF